MRRLAVLWVAAAGVVLTLASLTFLLILVRERLRVTGDLFTAVREDRADKISSYISGGRDPNVANELGFTPLHLAGAYGFQRCAGVLLEGGASVNAVDNAGNTPLHFAAEENRPEMVRFLVANGALLNAQNAIGDTPLHFAARRFATEAAESLLRGGAIVDTKNAVGQTPMDDAMEIHDRPMVALLVRYGARAGSVDWKTK